MVVNTNAVVYLKKRVPNDLKCIEKDIEVGSLARMGNNRVFFILCCCSGLDLCTLGILLNSVPCCCRISGSAEFWLSDEKNATAENATEF